VIVCDNVDVRGAVRLLCKGDDEGEACYRNGTCRSPGIFTCVLAVNGYFNTTVRALIHQKQTSADES
jgi:hypothetical protein